MPKILITTSSFGATDSTAGDLLSSAGHQIVKNPLARTLTEEEITRLLGKEKPIGIIAGLEPLTASVLKDAAPHLKVISRCGTGLDNVDTAAAEKLGIAVLNTPAAPAEAVAELTVGLIFALIRNLTHHDHVVRAGFWSKKMGVLLSEITLGIIGLGRVGKRVASVIQPFGARVLACETTPDHEWIAAHGVSLVTLSELLGASDIVSLHLPYATGELHYLMNADRLKSMKRGSSLINTSRGALIDEEALCAALRDEHLAGAAIDVFEHEPYHGPLTKFTNVILSPHAGSYARATRNRMELEAAQNLLGALAKSAA
jgi:D-3-phosphoglycerate dehydrogenase / 2-oxoglutarate reductase